jgi:hypothetical protein
MTVSLLHMKCIAVVMGKTATSSKLEEMMDWICGTHEEMTSEHSVTF